MKIIMIFVKHDAYRYGEAEQNDRFSETASRIIWFLMGVGDFSNAGSPFTL
jgi:hypothetical protein